MTMTPAWTPAALIARTVSTASAALPGFFTNASSGSWPDSRPT